MKKMQTALWQLMIPDEWESEEEEESVILYHPEGPGVLQLSAIQHDDPVTDQDLGEMAHEHLDAGAQPIQVELGDFDGLEINYSDGDQYWREWYLACDNIMLFITYNCDEEEEEQEDVVVDAVLETLALGAQ